MQEVKSFYCSGQHFLGIPSSEFTSSYKLKSQYRSTSILIDRDMVFSRDRDWSLILAGTGINNLYIYGAIDSILM